MEACLLHRIEISRSRAPNGSRCGVQIMDGMLSWTIDLIFKPPDTFFDGRESMRQSKAQEN
jgi:hypothetical protein